MFFIFLLEKNFTDENIFFFNGYNTRGAILKKKKNICIKAQIFFEME